MGWLLLRQRERLVAARKAARASSPGAGRVAGSRQQSSRLPGSDTTSLSLAFFPLCAAVRNDGLRTHSSPVAVPDCSPLYGGTLWLVHTFSPPANHTDYCVERLDSLFSWWASHGEQLAVGNRREFFLCSSRVRAAAPSIDSLFLLIV